MNEKIDSEREKILEPFRVALKLEREGKKFLLEAAAKSTHPVARRTFEYLASEEDIHAEKIQRLYQAIAETGESIDPDADESEAEGKVAEFNDRLAELKDSVKATAGDIEAYNTALEMEEDTEQFYHDRIAETDDPNIQRIYRYLIAEEKGHSAMLRSCLEFMEDPREWFVQREQKS